MNNPIIIHTDGGARGNPGPAAVGVYMEQDGKVLHKFGKQIGDTTNNVAEYTAVIEALRYLTMRGVDEQGTMIQFFLDSKLVVEQLNGNYKIKDAKLRELSLNVRMLEQDIVNAGRGLGIAITYTYTPREQNKEADLLVNQALDG